MTPLEKIQALAAIKAVCTTLEETITRTEGELDPETINILAYARKGAKFIEESLHETKCP